MKSLIEVFDESFTTMSRLVHQENYLACGIIARDLTRLSTLCDFADGILIGEVCEGVFDQIIPELGQHEVSKADRDTLSKQLAEAVSSMAKSYQNKDKRELYESIRNLRGIGTRFQFKSWRTMKRRPDLEERTHRLEVS
jgi:hypothetical protein